MSTDRVDRSRQAVSEFDVQFAVDVVEGLPQSAIMRSQELPTEDRLYDALLQRDAAFEGVFLFAVKTTGIFCRPTCPARRPRRENVEFFTSAAEALFQGYRPCRRCLPLDRDDPPRWLRPLLDAVEAAPEKRWRDADLRSMGLEPSRVRRWFKAKHDMTFQAYSRARRLGIALGRLRRGSSQLQTAQASGFDSLSGFRDALERLTGSTPRQSTKQPVVMMTRIATALGPMVAGASDEGLCLLEFADRRMLETQILRLQKRTGCVITPGDHSMFDELEEQLGQYFEGQRREFDLPLHLVGTEFQMAVWQALGDIPFGETRSYEDLARSIGRPKAVRAVGRANGDNRLAIFIPCHRVIGSNGKLTGYGGGLWRKRRLLEIEGLTPEDA